MLYRKVENLRSGSAVAEGNALAMQLWNRVTKCKDTAQNQSCKIRPKQSCFMVAIALHLAAYLCSRACRIL